MPDGWESAGLESITVPADAGPNDPRTYVGSDDPIALALGRDTAIVMYWYDQRCYLISVAQNGSPNQGDWSLWSWDEVNAAKRQHIDVTHDVNLDYTQIYFNGSWSQDAATQYMDLNGTEITLVGDLIELQGDSSLRQEDNSDVTIYEQSMARGVKGVDASQAASAPIGAVEVTVLTIPSRTYFKNRAYRVVCEGMVSGAVANTRAEFVARKFGSGVVGNMGFTPIPLNGVGYAAFSSRVFHTGTNNATTALVLNLRGIGGNVVHEASAGNWRTFYVEDIGHASEFPNSPILL